MIQLKKTILTLVALLAVTTGAWAEGTYTVTFAANGNTKTVENVTLPKTFQCNYDKANGELDLILKELYSWTGNANQTFCDGETTPTSSDENKVVAGSDNGDHYITINNVFEGTVTITGYYVVNSVVIETPYSLEISIAAAAPAVDIDWDAAAKTGTFTQPAGNVTVSVEYYDLATLADKGLTAAEDAAAKTEAPLAVLAENAVTGGTLMYFVIYDENFSQADAIALAEDEWEAAIPTAETIEAAGTYYVWYYIKGDDEHSDTDPQRLAVTVLPEPTYTVEFAEGTNNAPNKWTATPNPAKKGQQVTVTYEGPRKVMGVKAEKKAAGIVNPVVGQIIGSDGNNYDANATLPDGVTKVAMIAYVSGSNGLALALTDEGIYTWDNSAPYNNGKTAPEICSALNTSKAVTGGTWKLPSRDEWMQMFSANGGNDASYTGLNTAIGNAGGTALVENDEYWSSSEVEGGDAWLVNLSDGNASWDTYGKHYSRYVRACLAF